MEAITITLNGREVSGHPGMTVLELAGESGVDIPTLCHDPHLPPIGACRICLVEDERSGKLSASCVTPIEPGMVINTESPKVKQRRRTIIMLMLASHPDSCMVCDKGNRCELRKIAADAGIGHVDLQRIPQMATIEEVNPFIERDLSKCILCAKCIRADHELVVEGAIDYIHRGFASRPATLNDLPLERSECTFCGTCVAICPTGALMEKRRTYAGTAHKSVSTTCPYCGCGCTIILEVKDNRIVRTRPGSDNPVNRGTMCVKAAYGCDFVHSPERLTRPLIKKDGDIEAASWVQALDLVASELSRVKKATGPDSIAILASAECTNEEAYLLQRFARSVLGTNNIDNTSRLYGAPSIMGLGAAVGFPGTTNHIEALEQSEVIMVIGANPDSSAPAVTYAVKRAVKYRGAKLVLVDPQRTRLSSFARHWLRPRVGTDIALLNGMARIIITEGLLDEEFVTRKTDNFEALSGSLEEYTPEFVEEVSGVPAGEMALAARLFAGASVASIVYGNGITQHVGGTEAVTALANLAMLTGNIGGMGGVYALQRDCNSQGTCDMGMLPDLLPGYVCVDSDQASSKFAEVWGAQLPPGPGLTALEMIEGARQGRIKAMYILGEDPVVSFPNPAAVREALASLDFLVVNDLFLTETARMANVVLPAASFAEKDGTYTNFEGRVQRLHKAIEQFDGSLPELEVVLRLATSMGSPMPYSSLQQVMEEMQALVPLYQPSNHRELENKDIYRAELDREPIRSRRLFKGQFPSTFGRFSAVRYEPPAEAAKDRYPFTLLAGSVLHHSGTGARSSKSSRLNGFSPHAYVELGESDARRVGVGEGDAVKVLSPAGEVSAAARLTDRLPEGTVFMPLCFPSAPVNQLFEIALDPRAKTPALKACAVKLERV